MLPVQDIIAELKSKHLDEQDLGALLNRWENEKKVSLSFFFDSKERLWESCLTVGNDLLYFGNGATLQQSLIDSFEDYERSAHIPATRRYDGTRTNL